MLNPPQSSPHGEAAWATEEHCTRGSEAWTLVRLWVQVTEPGESPKDTHSVGKGLCLLHSSSPTQHLELQLACTWKISINMLLLMRCRVFIYEIVVLSPRRWAGKAG